MRISDWSSDVCSSDLIVPGILNWAVFDAVFYAGSRDECRELGSGACWGLATVRFGQFLYGFYPDHLRWRIDLTAVLFLLALVPVLWDTCPYRRYWFIRSEEHTSEPPSLMPISYAVFCL